MATVLHCSLGPHERELLPRNQMRLSWGNDLVTARTPIFLLSVFLTNRLDNPSAAPFCFHSPHARSNAVEIELLRLLIAIAVTSTRHELIPVLLLGVLPGGTGRSIPRVDIAQTPSNLRGGVCRPILASARHLGARKRLRDAIGPARSILGEVIPARFLRPQRVKALVLALIHPERENELAGERLSAARIRRSGCWHPKGWRLSDRPFSVANNLPPATGHDQTGLNLIRLRGEEVGTRRREVWIS